jgi:hypothetical protein
MESRVVQSARARNFAVIALVAHVGGAVLLGGAAFPYLGLPAVFVLGSLLGWVGIALGVSVLLLGAPADAAGEAPARRPWLAIGGGVVASVAVTTVSLAATAQRGFLDASPCEGPRLLFGTADTLIPAQYTCVYGDGVVALVNPLVLALISFLALAGAAAIAYGLWSLRSAHDETRARWIAAPVALFLAVDGVLGAVALVAPAALAAIPS